MLEIGANYSIYYLHQCMPLELFMESMCLYILYLHCIYIHPPTISFRKYMPASSTFSVAYTFRIFQLNALSNSLSFLSEQSPRMSANSLTPIHLSTYIP